MLRKFCLWLLASYKKYISPLLGQHCRFHPSCSAYAYECFSTLPLHRAFAKSLYRILRCNPWSPGGYDPV